VQARKKFGATSCPDYQNGETERREMHVAPDYQNNHSVSDAIKHHAQFSGNRTALVCADERYNWSELDTALNRLANALVALGCAKGTKVCMLLPNGVSSFLLFWATVRAGCVIVPLNPMLDDAALARLATASDGVLLFADGSTRAQVDRIRGALPHVREDGFHLFGEAASGWASADALLANGNPDDPPVRVSPSDPMTIFFTSGTTGTPKGIEHDHFGRLNYCYGFGPGLGINRYSTAICVTPIYASGTMITMLPTLYYGGKVVMVPKFSPAGFMAAVERERGTHSFMVPAMYVSLLQHEDQTADLSSLKVLVSAGQTMPLITRDALAARIPGAGIHEVYGMTEGFFTLAVPEDFALGKRNTVGKPGFLEDIRILDEHDAELPVGEVGEIVAYGPGMMKGYYGRPDLTSEMVWCSPAGRTYLRSGDLGSLDEDGFLYVSGRKKDMIKSGGINIYAADLEEVLLGHPAIGEAAVVGIPHPRWMETPIGVVVLRPGQSASGEDLCEWVNTRLSKYQRLSRVIVRQDFPRATYGKIQKDKLREEYHGLEGG
jgi:acyl-CoA synthetase (AMP-forming)/AMP-acid ligase II